jgi:uncharacterized protein YqeY
MSLEQRLTDDMKAAMKAGEKETLGVVRRVLSALKNARIEKKADLDEQDEPSSTRRASSSSGPPGARTSPPRRSPSW